MPERMFMCRDDWTRLPKAMQRAVWAEYVPGQEVRKDPTDEYISVTREAIEYLEQLDAIARPAPQPLLF